MSRILSRWRRSSAWISRAMSGSVTASEAQWASMAGTVRARRLPVKPRRAGREAGGAGGGRLGGIAIFLGFLVGFGLASVIGPFRGTFQWGWPPSEPVAVAIGASVIFALGIIDDVRGLAAPTKLAGQILAAGFVFLGGVRLQW